MKLNIANPPAGLQKTIEVDDEKKMLPFYERRMGAEVSGDSLGDEFKGYVFRISGGNDKQGFPMLQGVLVNHRVRLLFRDGMKCYRSRRKGTMKRKSVRGCIVGPDLAVMNLVMVEKGENEIPGLTDEVRPKRLGPKRASKIRKLFNLPKTEDVTKYVVRRIISQEPLKWKAPKIQRLITPRRLMHKRRKYTIKDRERARKQAALAEYKVILEQHKKALMDARASAIAKKKKEKEPVAAAPKTKPAAAAKSASKK